MYSTSEFRNGLKIEYEGEPYIVVEFQHVKPGKGGAFVRTKIKSLLSGRVIDPTFRSGDKVGKPDMEEREMQFLYSDGEQLHFMDNNTYDQIPVNVESAGDTMKWLVENMDVDILFWKNKAINIALPNFVVLLITESDPGIKGDTATGATKPATLETGAIVQVPLFVNEGEKIKIDTRTGSYVERVK